MGHQKKSFFLEKEYENNFTYWRSKPARTIRLCLSCCRRFGIFPLSSFYTAYESLAVTFSYTARLFRAVPAERCAAAGAASDQLPLLVVFGRAATALLRTDSRAALTALLL